MERKGLLRIVGLLVMASMILAACQAAPTTAPTAVPAPTEAPAEAEPTEAAPTEEVVEPTEEPTEEPVEATTRKGGWLDEIVFSVVDGSSAITQLQAGAIDIYADSLASSDFPELEASGLNYRTQAGTYYNLLFNPSEFNDGRFNPFTNRKIREALNYAIDREWINQEIYAGGSLPKYFPITTQFPDYADLAETALGLEQQYAYNLETAREIITTELEAAGATLTDGKWVIDGEPITLIFVIRNDGDGTRLTMGDYISNQLEDLGFTVDRQYKTGGEASPIWIGSDPKEGLWHIYTAGWSATRLDRDQKTIFQEMYLPESAQGLDVFLQNQPDPAFSDVGNRLARGLFATAEERHDLMVEALALSLQDSISLWLVDGRAYIPFDTDVEVTGDLAAGVQGAQVWPQTLRFVGQEGGSMKVGENALFTEPFNPIAGSNWVWDQMIIRAISQNDLMSDPYTGLLHAYRVESIKVTYDETLPVADNLGWVEANPVASIEVPGEALVDWDATTQTFIDGDTKFPEGQTAKVKIEVTYPADLFETVKWHDGSNLEVADFIFTLIMTFDRAKPESAIYDEQAVPTLDSFLSAFKGFTLDSTDPLKLTYYTDSTSLDLEWLAGAGTGNSTIFWPYYQFGEASWSELAVANAAEAAGELAYSDSKAAASQTEQTSFIGGPSLEILAANLDTLIENATIPYEPTLGQYITPEDAVARYEALKAFYETYGHFWAGSGPYYIDSVHLTETSLVLKNNSEYVDLADRWSGFGAPKIATVDIDGPGQVTIGEEVAYDVYITFEDEPYPVDEIKQVKFLLFNAANEIVYVDFAEAVEDGLYSVVLPADVTAALEAGANKLEVAVVPSIVSIPTFTSIDFITQ